MACDTSHLDQMPIIDHTLLEAIIDRLQITCRDNDTPQKTLIYTGGTWLFGNSTKQDPITEQSLPSAYSPLPEYSYMLDSIKLIENYSKANLFRGMIIHPAVVVDGSVDNGIPSILRDEYNDKGTVPIPISKHVVWPLVDVNDLAEAYKLILEKGRSGGENYIVTGSNGSNVYKLGEKLISLLDNKNRRQNGIVGRELHPQIKPIEHWVDLYGNVGYGYGKSQYLSSNKIKKQLGWKPKVLY